MHLRIMLAGLLFAQLADAASFAVGVAIHGVTVESNGFAVLAWEWSGAGGVLLVKGAAIVAALWLLVVTAARFPRLFVWGAATATSIGLVGVLANVTSLLLLS